MERLSILMSQQSRNPHQNSKDIPHRTKIMGKKALKSIWEHKRLQIVNKQLSKKSNARCIIISDFKLYQIATVTETAWCWHKSRHANQGSRIKDPEPIPLTYTYQILNKGTNKQTNKQIHRREDNLFNKQCRENQTPMCQRNETSFLCLRQHKSHFRMN